MYYVSIISANCAVSKIHGYKKCWMELFLDLVTKLSLSPIDVFHCLEILRRCPDLSESHCTFKSMYSLAGDILLPSFPGSNLLNLNRSIIPSLTLPAARTSGQRTARSIAIYVHSSDLRSLASAQLRIVLYAIPSLIELEIRNTGISNNENLPAPRPFRYRLPKSASFETAELDGH
jgi:hypothetical protein